MIDLKTLTENELRMIAELDQDDVVAGKAMKELQERFDKTYDWCWDCDGIVGNSSDHFCFMSPEDQKKQLAMIDIIDMIEDDLENEIP